MGLRNRSFLNFGYINTCWGCAKWAYDFPQSVSPVFLAHMMRETNLEHELEYTVWFYKYFLSDLVLRDAGIRGAECITSI